MEEIVAPDFGESVFEASVGKWFKQSGEQVSVGEPIVELHTDKAVQEINAVTSGTLGTILKQVDDLVRPGDALCEFQSEIVAIATETDEESDSDLEQDVAPTEEATASSAIEIEQEASEPEESDEIVEIDFNPFVEESPVVIVEIPSADTVQLDETEDDSEADEETQDDHAIEETQELITEPVTEVFEEIVEESVVVETDETKTEPESAEDIAEPAGELAEDTTELITEIVAEVVEPEAETAIVEVEEPEIEPEQEPAVPVIPAQDAQVTALTVIEESKPVRRERLSRRRLTTARRMAQVQAEAVMTTTYNEVDMHEVIRIRRDFGDQFIESNGVKLGFMSFFVKAVINGLKAFPILNSELDSDELVYKEYYDIGVAVASDHGLVVPVIRDADTKSFADLEREIRQFAEKAGTGAFSLADLVGGTFTITNGGVFGSMMSTPILNPPQVGILGMHNIVDRPAVVDGQITVRPMMYLAVTYDHRVVEGAQAVQFLMRIKESLESAELLMLAS